MSNLEKWNEITKGLFRYVVGANVCYEIQLIYYEHNTDVLQSEAMLYLVGDWYNGKSFFTREPLTEKITTVKKCLEIAERDFKENMQ